MKKQKVHGMVKLKLSELMSNNKEVNGITFRMKGIYIVPIPPRPPKEEYVPTVCTCDQETDMHSCGYECEINSNYDEEFCSCCQHCMNNCHANI